MKIKLFKLYFLFVLVPLKNSSFSPAVSDGIQYCRCNSNCDVLYQVKEEERELDRCLEICVAACYNFGGFAGVCLNYNANYKICNKTTLKEILEFQKQLNEQILYKIITYLRDDLIINGLLVLEIIAFLATWIFWRRMFRQIENNQPMMNIQPIVLASSLIQNFIQPLAPTLIEFLQKIPSVA